MPMFIGLGLGLVKAETDQQSYQKQKTLAAQTQRYSPWTGNKATAPMQPSAVGDVGSGMVTGMQMGQNQQNAQNANQLQQAQIGWLKANPGASPASAGVGTMMGGGGMNPYGQANPYSVGAGMNMFNQPNPWSMGVGQ